MVLVLDNSSAHGAKPKPASRKPSIAGRGREGLREALAAIGVPEKQLRMRVEQLWSWLYVRGALSFDQMSDVSKELRARGINVNAVLPSLIDTPTNRRDMPEADFSRWVKPAEVAAVMCFLGSDASSAVHGALVPVAGLS